MNQRGKLFALILFLLVAIDWGSKAAALHFLPMTAVLYNDKSIPILAMIFLTVTIIVLFTLMKTTLMTIALAVLSAGMIANSIERFYNGAVVDFIPTFYPFNVVFNLADLFLMTGMLMIFFAMRAFEEEKEPGRYDAFYQITAGAVAMVIILSTGKSLAMRLLADSFIESYASMMQILLIIVLISLIQLSLWRGKIATALGINMGLILAAILELLNLEITGLIVLLTVLCYMISKTYSSFASSMSRR